MRFVLFGADGTPLVRTDAVETAVEMAAEHGSHSSRSIEAAMSVIAVQTEPHRVTRMFFDCNASADRAADRVDQRRIEVAIENSIAIAEPEDGAPGDVGHHRRIEHRRAVMRTVYRAAVAHPSKPGHGLPIAVMARVTFS